MNDSVKQVRLLTVKAGWLLYGVLLAVVTAQTLTPADFAEGVSITLNNSNAVQRVALPDSLYATVTRPDLGDIRVFNAAGEVVPYAMLGRNQAQLSEQLELPLYPLPVAAETLPAGLSLQIQQNEAGTQIAIDSTSPGEAATTPKTVGSYIVDARLLAAGAAQLSFDWARGTPFVSELTYQTSNDLANWSDPLTLGALAELEQGDFSLVKNMLELPQTARYIWLKPRAGERLPALLSLSAEQSRLAEAAPLRFKDAPHVSSAEAANQYVFDAGGYYVVQALKLQSQPNVLARITLESSNTLDSWSHKYSGTFFNLTRDGTVLLSPELSIPETRARYWRLTVDPAGGGFGATAPGLALGIRPETLAFVARGEAPFMLAYGNVSAEPESFEAQLLSTELVEPSSLASLSAPFELAGAAALSQKNALPWQQILLWTVLLGGVALLAVLAMTLLKQAKPETRSEG